MREEITVRGATRDARRGDKHVTKHLGQRVVGVGGDRPADHQMLGSIKAIRQVSEAALPGTGVPLGPILLDDGAKTEVLDTSAAPPTGLLPDCT